MKEDLPGELEEFKAKCWPEAEIFVDIDQDLYRVASSGDLKQATGCGLCAWVCRLLANRDRRVPARAAHEKYGNNTIGEGFILGSVLVVDPTGTIRFAHAEQDFDDHPDFSEVVAEAAACAAEVPATAAA